MNIKDDISLSWLQELDFDNIDEFVSFFQYYDKEHLKKQIVENINDSELIKTIKPKLFFLHKLANIITFIHNLNDILSKQEVDQKKNIENIFNLKILYNEDYLANEFIKDSGKIISEEIKEILLEYIKKNLLNNVGNSFSMNVEYLQRSEQTHKDLFSIENINFNIIIDYQFEKILKDSKIDLFYSDANANNSVKKMFFFKALPKSDLKLNKDSIKELIKKKVNEEIKQETKANNIIDNFMKLFISEENEFFKYLVLNLIKINSLRDSLNKDFLNENYFAFDEEIDLKDILNKTKEKYFQSKPLELICSEGNFPKKELVVSQKITLSEFFKSSNLNYFSEAFLNLNSFSEFIFKYNNSYLQHKFSYLNTWDIKNKLKNQIKIEGIVTHGLKRGSKLLGIPTANLTPFDSSLIKHLINGVYYGDFIFLDNKNNNQNIILSRKYKGVLSIGYNPQFDNKEKTIEVFLIDFEGEDFYEYKVHLNIIGYIRTEAAFENFQELVTSISYDIIVANSLF